MRQLRRPQLHRWLHPGSLRNVLRSPPSPLPPSLILSSSRAGLANPGTSELVYLTLTSPCCRCLLLQTPLAAVGYCPSSLDSFQAGKTHTEQTPKTSAFLFLERKKITCTSYCFEPCFNSICSGLPLYFCVIVTLAVIGSCCTTSYFRSLRIPLQGLFGKICI